MQKVIQTLVRTGGSVVLVGSLVAACASAEHTRSSSAARSAAPWVQNLNEPPPSRQPADVAPGLREDSKSARERTSR
jgi:hypothetical protein